jgi:hypothetical protein
MTLLSPWALWLLSLSAIVIVVYFLKRQARPVTVSALFLWRGIERRPRSALRLRWTQLLGLILQLLTLTALATGLAQPALHVQAGGARSLAIVLDASASMRARLGPQGPMRYQRAIERALALMRANLAAEIALIAAYEHSQVLVPLTRDHAELERQLQRFVPTYEGDARPDELISLVQSQAPSGFERVVFFTDYPPAFDAQALGWEVRIVAAEDESTQNVAITRFAVRPQPDQAQAGYGLFLELWNSGPGGQRARLELYSDGRLFEARDVDLPPGKVVSLSASYRGPPASRFEARLRLPEGIRDDWPEDNVRYATPPLARPWRVLQLGEPSPYIERFLRRAGLAEFVPSPSGSEGGRAGGESVDWVLVHGLREIEPEPGRYLLLGSGLPPWVQLDESVDLTRRPLSVRSDHPLLEGIDPTNWRLLRAPSARVDPRGAVLIEAGSVPVLYLYEAPGLRIAYLGVDLEASNLWLTVDFPILLYRLLSWLSPRAAEDAQLVIGDELPLTLAGSGARLVRPDGRTCPLDPLEGSRCGLIDQPGFYSIVTGGDEAAYSRVYAANLPASESRQIAAGAGRSAPSAVPIVSLDPSAAGALDSEAGELKAVRPLWREVFMAGLLLLLAELWYFDRALLPVGLLRRIGRG